MSDRFLLLGIALPMNAMRAAFAASAPGTHRYFVIGRMQTRAIIRNYRLMAGNGGEGAA